jgi:peptide/nickel transport system permease protein
LSGVLEGNLGDSLWSETTVLGEIKTRWPVTFELGLLGLLVGQLITLPIGVFSAMRQDTWGDYAARSFAILCMAVPGFWLGTLVIVFPAIWWGYMPPIIYVPFFHDPGRNLQMFIVPAVVLGMGMAGTGMRMTRTMMLEVLRQDYIRTAWSKGLSERVVVMRHALKNAFIPIITILGLELPVMIGGSVIIEQIFSLPGMGRLLVDAVRTRDYTIVSGVIVIYTFGIMLINLAVDLTYSFLDPRVRFG